jgi:beta-N-acetylhexosaminidase
MLEGMHFRRVMFACACALVCCYGPNATASEMKAAAKSKGRRSTTVSAGVASRLRALSLHDRIAQMFVVRGYGDYPPSTNAEYQRFERWISQTHVGGFIVAGRIRDGNIIQAQPFEMAAFVNHAQRIAKTPLLVGSDFERGASMRVAGTARFPYMMAFGAAGDLNAVRELGAATAREARTLGVTWVFAPDADVNNDPENPIINVRSFGEDPNSVASDVGAFIDGAHSDPTQYVLISAKHFPGHGDTAEDSHLQLARLNKPKEQIESVELVPFRAAVAHGADSIMTAHLAVPALEPAAIPATLSRNILTNVLRDELNFKGLVVTDAMEMQGVTSLFGQGEASVRAVEAGADVLLMPVDPETCIRAIEAAIASGRLTRARIDASVVRILEAKQRVGLFKRAPINLDKITDDLEAERFGQLAEHVAEKAFTLVKDDKHLFPMPSAEGSCLVIMGEGQFSQRGEILVRDLHRGAPDVKVYVVNASTPEGVLAAVATDTSHCRQIYVGAFVTVNASRGNVALENGLATLLRTMSKGTVPTGLVSFGNPYLLRDFPDVTAYAATFSTAVSSEQAVAKAMLGQMEISGKMPVSIPGFAKVGDGLAVPRR